MILCLDFFANPHNYALTTPLLRALLNRKCDYRENESETKCRDKCRNADTRHLNLADVSGPLALGKFFKFFTTFLIWKDFPVGK